MYSPQRSRCCSIVGYCLILLFCSLAVAQDHPRSGSANIPFDFYVSGTKMLAGQYTLDIIAPTYVTLRSQDGKQQQQLYFVQTAAPGKNDPAKIIFNLRNGKYYFSQVWSWFGKAQLTSFVPKPSDQMKEVPLQGAEKDVAKPAGSL
jgi:hypothetical protein